MSWLTKLIGGRRRGDPNSCTACGGTLVYDAWVPGFAADSVAYKCRACGAPICQKCARNRRCPRCGERVFDRATRQPAWMTAECTPEQAEAASREREEREQAKTREQTERTAEIQAWLDSPEIRPLLERDAISRDLARWLLARVGQKVEVKYVTDQGRGYAFSALWVVPAPERCGSTGLRWRLPREILARGDVTVDLAEEGTYRELACERETLTYRLGWKDVGFAERVQRAEDVDYWEVMTFVG